jgi:phytoene synthase
MIQNETLSPKESLAANGKTFNWARRFLGTQMGDNATRLYAFCRLLDDLADDDIPDGPARLSQIYKALQYGGYGDDPAFTSFKPFMLKMGFSPVILSTLIEGLMQDQSDEVCLVNESELLRYAYRVAGTVGLLMCEVLECPDNKAKAYAIDLGIGMQLTNIARDVLEDARMGRRYIPADWVNNLSPADICLAADYPKSKNANLIRASVVRLIRLSEKYYQSGACGYHYLPWRAHFSIAIAARVYQQIGIQILETGITWHQGRQVTN